MWLRLMNFGGRAFPGKSRIAAFAFSQGRNWPGVKPAATNVAAAGLAWLSSVRETAATETFVRLCTTHARHVFPDQCRCRTGTLAAVWGAGRGKQLTTTTEARANCSQEKTGEAVVARSELALGPEDDKALLRAIRESSSLRDLDTALRRVGSSQRSSRKGPGPTPKSPRSTIVADAVRTKLASWKNFHWDASTSECISEIIEKCVYGSTNSGDSDISEIPAMANVLAGWTPWVRWLRPDTVTRLYRSMEQACTIALPVSTKTYTALWKYRIQALGCLRWPHDLDECFDYCRRHRLRPDTILMNTMLDGYCNGSRGGLHQPSWRHRRPAQMHVGEPTEFLQVFLERMLQEWRLLPDTSTLNIMLEFLSRRGLAKEAMAVYDRWVDVRYALGTPHGYAASPAGLEPDVLTFRTLFRTLDPRWRPLANHAYSECSLGDWCNLADEFLPRLRSRLHDYIQSKQLNGNVLDSVLVAQLEAYAYTGKGAEVMQLLPGNIAELPRLVVVAIRGLAFNVRAVRLAHYAFEVFETYVHGDKARQRVLPPEVLRSVLDALLVACDRTRNARRALDYFHLFANGEIADTAILPSRVGLRALVRAHSKAPAALWPALAECLAIASAEGIRLDTDAIHRLEQHYGTMGPLASTAHDQVQRIVNLMINLDR